MQMKWLASIMGTDNINKRTTYDFFSYPLLTFDEVLHFYEYRSTGKI